MSLRVHAATLLCSLTCICACCATPLIARA
jgi:hypothetical protein